LIKSGLIPSLFFLNAGISGIPALEDRAHFDLEKHKAIMAVNYFGVLAWLPPWLNVCQEHGVATFMVTSSVNALYAPPTASAYSASKAAIARAFEGLSVTYARTNLRFSVVYAGPVDTKGLSSIVPFTWKPEKMARYMIRCALKGQTHCESHLFYALASRVMRHLPYTWAAAIMRRVR
jgi:3-hydroxy acid dehydrogenase/malonic semialdehyde reductase